LDGSNPLAFLAALGLFRVMSDALPDYGLQMVWTKYQGAWRPSILSARASKLSDELILDSLGDALSTRAEEHPALRLAVLIDARGMRGAFTDAVQEARLESRSNADWLSCNGSDMAGPESISQLQTTRRDYHAINVAGLVTQTTRDHLRRSLFEPWNYSDPIAGVSLHLEPREDRRHAYQWHMPSGDPTRKAVGGMIGANRLALEAWPLFQSLPYQDKLTTVGFKGIKANNTQFTWPIWSAPVTLAVLPSLLALRELQSSEVSGARLEPMGIAVVFRCSRILVGKTPNLTSPVAVLA
jgi:CRISPR-associated endonuclease/helicase Cas3